MIFTNVERRLASRANSTGSTWRKSVPIALTLLAAFAMPAARANSVLTIVPAYFDPTGDPADWNRLCTMAKTGSMAIMNPNNGPYIGTSPTAVNQTTDQTAINYQTKYKTQVTALHSHGLLAIGYVSTMGGTRPYVPYTNDQGNYDQGVYADIDEWKNLYGVDGIFLDEGPGGGTWASPLPNFTDFTSGRSHGAYPNPGVTTGNQYYTPVFSHIRGDLPSGPVILNCGIPTDEGYMNVCTVLCNAEEPYATYLNNSWLQANFASTSWVYHYAANRFLHLSYGTASSVAGLNNVMEQAQTWNAGYVYATDLGGWSGLASNTVWTPEVGYGVSGAIAAPPTSLAASSGNNSIGLTWAASSGATSYNVYRATTTDGELTTSPLATGLTGTSYTDSTAVNGTTYFYRVAAVKSAGISGESNEVSASPHVGAPGTPTGLAAAAGNTQVSLTWSATSGATSYNLYRSTTSGGEGMTAYKTGLTGTSTIDTGLTNGTTYYYKLAAVNSGGTSGQSSEVNAKPIATVPPVPTGVNASPANAQVTVTWSTSVGASSYNLYRSTTAGGEGTTAYRTALTGTSFTDTGLTNGTTYYYKLAAVNSAGTSAQSAEVHAAPSNASIFNPTETISGGNVTFSFNYTGTWTYFHVFLDTDRVTTTGYSIAGIGGDDLMENGFLYTYGAGSGTTWSWNSAGTVTYTNTGSVASFTVALSTLGNPAHINAVYQVVGSTTYTTGAFNY